MTEDEIKDTHQIMKEQGAQDSNIRKATAASCTWSIDKPRRWVRWEESDGSRSIRKLEERKGQADLGREREIRVLGSVSAGHFFSYLLTSVLSTRKHVVTGWLPKASASDKTVWKSPD